MNQLKHFQESIRGLEKQSVFGNQSEGFDIQSKCHPESYRKIHLAPSEDCEQFNFSNLEQSILSDCQYDIILQD